MRATITAVLALLAIGCTDFAPTSLEPPERDGAAAFQVFTNAEANRRYRELLNNELGNPAALRLNALAASQTVDERKRSLRRTIAELEAFPSLNVSSQACDQSAQFTKNLRSHLLVIDPIFEGGSQYAASAAGYSQSTAPAKHRIYAFVTGGPGYGGHIDYTQGNEADSTSVSCVTEFWGGPTSLDSPRAKLRWIPIGFESPREPSLRAT